ncbi:MAG: DEAD/DEAH box helicase [Bacteroidales bacterium]|nr:DEAD/DEAH box helicase [Bacteroidales bacterium]
MRFEDLDLEPEVLDGLDAMNFIEATPIQELTIPVVLEGKDIIACAQTGTGKTAAYILPLLNLIMRHKFDGDDDAVRAIIIAPTRELASQIDMQFEGFSYFMPISTLSVSGGGDGAQWDQQKRAFNKGADVIIATPGRMISHLINSKISLDSVEYLVLDEADRMLDMGFYDDIMKISKHLPSNRQTLLFSATMPPKIRTLAKNILNNPAEINVAISKPNEAIKQMAYVCYEPQKIGLVEHIFSNPIESKTIIFSSSKIKVKELAHTLKRMKYNVRAMHSDLEQSQRDEVMLDFKNGKVDILVATDIVARGIDITDIGLVINYDVPHDPEDYIHRIGRTARANAEGEAITFISEKEQDKFGKIERFLEREIEKIQIPEHLGDVPAYTPSVNEKKKKFYKRANNRKGNGFKGKKRYNSKGHNSNPHKNRGNNN